MSVSADTARPVQGPTQPTGSTPDEVCWRPHPVAARALRVAAVFVPVAASVVVVFTLDKLMPAPHSWELFAVIAALDVVIAFVVASLVNRLALRVLPLATLLSLSLVFPDRAPKRFAIALRANSTAQLRSRMSAAYAEDADLASALEDLVTYLAALSRHDRMTRGHCERVRAFVDLLAAEMDLPKADQDRLRWAALLHDIGKLRVPGPILRKPGAPTDAEWGTLRQHPVDGGKIIRPIAPWLGPWAPAVEQHHERFDGQGYPDGLAGTDISLGGRILAVADAYEVMITSRPYKRPVRPEAARQELVAHSGEQFDPDVVRFFLGIAIGDLRRVTGLLGVLSEVPLLATVPRAEALLEMAGRQTVGAVGTAAGTGALVIAASLSPVQVPAATTPAPSAVAPDAPSQPVAAAPAGDRVSSAGGVPSSLGPDGPNPGSGNSSTSSSATGVSVPDIGTVTTSASPEQAVGAVGNGVSLPAAVGSAEEEVGSTAGSVADDAADGGASIGPEVGSTATAAAEAVMSAADPATENTESAAASTAQGSAGGLSGQQGIGPDVVP